MVTFMHQQKLLLIPQKRKHTIIKLMQTAQDAYIRPYIIKCLYSIPLLKCGVQTFDNTRSKYAPCAKIRVYQRQKVKHNSKRG